MTESRRIVVLGGMAQMPYPGVAWQVLHYLEGFRRLGHDVVYLEDTGNWPYDPCDGYGDDAGSAVRRLEGIMRRHGFGDRWAYRGASRDGAVWGMPAPRFDAALADADVLVNLSGMTTLSDRHMAAPVRIYLETDPVNKQIEVARGEQAALDDLAFHTAYISFGERLGAAGCRVPVERFDYMPTRQPVVLDWWQPAPEFPRPPAGEPRFTTVANWEQTHRDVEWEGETYILMIDGSVFPVNRERAVVSAGESDWLRSPKDRSRPSASVPIPTGTHAAVGDTRRPDREHEAARVHPHLLAFGDRREAPLKAKDEWRFEQPRLVAQKRGLV